MKIKLHFIKNPEIQRSVLIPLDWIISYYTINIDMNTSSDTGTDYR